MLELQLISNFFIFGFILACLYEIVRFIKVFSKRFVFLHTIIDFTFFYFAIAYAFIKLNIGSLGFGTIYGLSFIITGFLLEKYSLRFLFDKLFQFVYTKFSKLIRIFNKSKLYYKIFK